MEKREVEVKARIKNKKVIEEKLRVFGCAFSEPVTQIDRIFVPIGKTIPVGRGINVLRIRKENGKVLFTLKQVAKNQLDKIEQEFEIIGEQEALNTIQLLGFEETVSVTKVRRKCRYKDFEVCLDEVEGLGSFIEVEKLTADDGQKVQDELFAFLQTLGVRKEEQVFFGYDILLLQKKQKHHSNS